MANPKEGEPISQEEQQIQQEPVQIYPDSFTAWEVKHPKESNPIYRHG